jgi:hypothetical protein
LIRDLEEGHTSYLRTNFYPPCQSKEIPSPLGISPHTDAGFLTILLQDDNCHSLQVFTEHDGLWVTVHPVPGALTINTGDMAQVWSNSEYRAPLHRVLTDSSRDRYSAPFFYNPGYETWVRPMAKVVNSDSVQAVDHTKYHDILWGYFRAVRFAGDLTDLGVELQIEDVQRLRNEGRVWQHHGHWRNYFPGDTRGEAVQFKPLHVETQTLFVGRKSRLVKSPQPFNVERYRELLLLGTEGGQ